jgi:hypothetical protein
MPICLAVNIMFQVTHNILFQFTHDIIFIYVYPSCRALCLLTLGHISGQHNIIVIITLNVFGDLKK